ncbi:MAG: cache domain-containing protein, partial [Selenomonadaceae bacterium]|nr:cache domain-containing protein [Selenomonadaceae bacterium]
MSKSNWQILKTGKQKDFLIITIITVIFLVVIAMNVRLIFRMTSNQTEEVGQMQLEVICSDFQETIYQAEGATLRVAMEAEQLIKAKTPLKEIEQFFYKRKHEQKHSTGGICFNTYIASKDWTIIPDFDMPPDYHAPERIWYRGAVDNPGKIYISEPYVDAMTGMMCYTMSKVLDDKETVVALDFTFSDVQYFIKKMSASSDHTALIVTKSGMIIGYNDMNLVGKRIGDKLPEYQHVLNRVVKTNLKESFTTNIDGE